MDLGWYCRNLQNQSNTDPNDSSDDEASQPRVDYHRQYIELKKKLKYLIYENECFTDSLHSAQRRLLKVTRDRSFLLDRLLQYEKPDETSESETDSDVSEAAPKAETKKRKAEAMANGGTGHQKMMNPVKKKKPGPKKMIMAGSSSSSMGGVKQEPALDMEEVERHLQSRQPNFQSLVPEHEQVLSDHFKDF